MPLSLWLAGMSFRVLTGAPTSHHSHSFRYRYVKPSQSPVCPLHRHRVSVTESSSPKCFARPRLGQVPPTKDGQKRVSRVGLIGVADLVVACDWPRRITLRGLVDVVVVVAAAALVVGYGGDSDGVRDSDDGAGAELAELLLSSCWARCWAASGRCSILWACACAACCCWISPCQQGYESKDGQADD